MSCNLLRILNFFYENYWPRLTSSSKCRGSVSHGDIKFWFSGNANCLSVFDDSVVLVLKGLKNRLVKKDYLLSIT